MKSSELVRHINRAANEREALSMIGDSDLLEDMSAYIRSLLEQKNMSIPELARLTGMERTALYRIVNQGRSTSRNALLRFAFVLELPLAETQTLLKYGRRCALSPRDRRDALLIFCLQRQYDLTKVEATLHEMKEKSLYERA